MYAWQSIPEPYKTMIVQAASANQVSLEETLRMFLIEQNNSGERTPHSLDREAMYGGVNTGLMGPTASMDNVYKNVATGGGNTGYTRRGVRQSLWEDENRFHPFPLILNK